MHHTWRSDHRNYDPADGHRTIFWMFLHHTHILAPDGSVRFVILKNVVGAGRLERRRDYLNKGGAQFWSKSKGLWAPKPGLFRMTHGNMKERT